MHYREFRVFDVATSLFYYLMVIGVAGPHAWAAVEHAPKYDLPRLAQVVQESQAQVEAYQKRLAAAGGAGAQQIEETLDPNGKALLAKLAAAMRTEAGKALETARWDEALRVAEDVRQLGEELATSDDDTKKAVGLAVALRGAEAQALVAHTLSKPADVRFWQPTATPTHEPSAT